MTRSANSDDSSRGLLGSGARSMTDSLDRTVILTRVASLIIGLAGLLFVALAIVQYQGSQGDPLTQRTAAAQALLDGGTQLARNIERTVSPAMERTRLLATNPEIIHAIQQDDVETLRALCNAAIQDSTEIDAIALFDAEGEIRAINTIYADGSSIAPFRIAQVMDRDYTQTAVVRQCVKNDSREEALEFQTSCDITPALFDSSGLSVAHSAPFFDPTSDKQVGVVSIRIRFDRITALAQEHPIAGGRGSLYFVTDDGKYFDEAINTGAEPAPFPSAELASLVEPLVKAGARYTVTQRIDQYIGLFRMIGFETITGGGIQILVAIDSDWVNREAILHRAVSAGLPAGVGALLLLLAGLVWTISVNRLRRVELVANESQFRSLVNNIPGVSYRCLLDSHWTMLFISDAIDTLSGYPASDFVYNKTRSFESIIHPDDRKMVATEIVAAVKNGASYTIEYRIEHADGDTRWVREKGQAASPVRDTTSVQCLDGAIFDVTDQVTMERLLAAERTRLAAFVRHAPAAVAMFDRNMVYQAASERWYVDYQLEGQQIVGKTHYEVFPDCPQRWRDIHARCLAGATERCDTDVWRPDGWDTDQVLRWEIRPWYDNEGQVAGIMMFTQDITADKAMERALEEKNASLTTTLKKLDEARLAADAANRAKSEFLANMSHEIRTPLTAILGYTDMLSEENKTPQKPAPRNDAIDTIRNAGDHLLVVINDILDLSKIEAGKMQVEDVEFNLPGVLVEVDSLMRMRAAERGVELDTVLQSPIPQRVQGDPTRVRQVLMNLVGNATKFTEHGKVTVRIESESTDDEPWIHFTIQDTGPGMTREQAESLFNPFNQADNSVTRKHGGTGLGLTISRRLSNLMGGDVWLDWTEAGKGSRFVFRLPLRFPPSTPMVNDIIETNESKASAPSSVEMSPTTLSARILVAEDNVVNQRLIAFHLEKAGATVDLAMNGKEALAAIHEKGKNDQPYDLLVTDMQMPEMDGYTLAKTLREEGWPLPIVALTAHAMAEDRQRCVDAGCNDYVSKPIDKKQLIAVCHRYTAAKPSA